MDIRLVKQTLFAWVGVSRETSVKDGITAFKGFRGTIVIDENGGCPELRIYNNDKLQACYIINNIVKLEKVLTVADNLEYTVLNIQYITLKGTLESNSHLIAV